MKKELRGEIEIDEKEDWAKYYTMTKIKIKIRIPHEAKSRRESNQTKMTKNDFA